MGLPWTGAETAVVGGGSGLSPVVRYMAFSPEWSDGRTPSTSSSVLHRCSPTRVETKHAIRQLTRETVLNSHFLRLLPKRRLVCREGERRMLSHNFLLKSHTGAELPEHLPALSAWSFLKKQSKSLHSQVPRFPQNHQLIQTEGGFCNITPPFKPKAIKNREKHP